MKSPIILVYYDQMNTSFKLLKSVVETIQANGLKVEMEELEDNDTYFYIVTYTNNWSKVTESKKLKKENPQQDEAVNSFFNQMDKYMDSKGTDMEALKGIENTANDVYKFRPEFTDMRYGDMYRALSKEYVRENKLTEALVRKLNKITDLTNIVLILNFICHFIHISHYMKVGIVIKNEALREDEKYLRLLYQLKDKLRYGLSFPFQIKQS